MTELKIMFWNIENVYDFKIVTPDELALEDQIGAGTEPSNETPESGDQKEERIKKLEAQAKKLFQQERVEHREKVASIIKAVDPDIVVMVELSVGKADLVKSGQVAKGKRKPIKNAFVEFDHWGPRQYQVSLNDLYQKERNKDRWWASATSQVNCSDLVPELNETGELQGIKHKNTMFELYGLLWDEKKVDLVGDFRVTNRRAKGKLNFFQRNPGVARFQEVGPSRRQFLLVMIHSGYGGKSTSVDDRKKRGKIISNLMYLNDVDKAINGPKFSPIVVAGDFNLDYGNQAEKGYYKPFEQQGFKERINGKTTLGKIVKTPPDTYTRNAYDNIFTRGFANDASPGGIKDFVKDEFGVPEPSREHAQKIEEALKISNHLPVYATVRF